jgi:flavin reductase (DIM6/NTAB) family NADH-FMN oxidoreductase RutF
VAESPVHFECRLYREIELGSTSFVVGEILRAHVSDAVLTDGRVDVLKLRPLARLGGDGYSVVREVLRLPRPVVERKPKPGP